MKIIADQRERNPELINALHDNGVEVEIKTIPAGDYILSDRICVERKTISDFESSIINGRLFEQLDKLRQAYEFPLVLIEGNVSEFRLNLNAIMGAVVSIYVEYRIQTIFCFDVFDTAKTIKTIAEHEQRTEKRMPSLKGSARAYSNDEFKEYMIGNLPGIGPKLARQLLSKFRTIKNMANSNAGELEKVEKIGQKKSRRIHEIFTEEYAAYDENGACGKK
ncbi:MAG: helix-hairpin-helix domain-containing protein [Candidatus Marsarchaeota archaeon]|nr:helix-hairpin-helix domain-containing protein [Candidatus Marsarchaeota archaeon]MCL5106158.1 helix-hairpin-helix domain-containing protein [Candidatus Marsarchaeota archaeon]